MKGDLSRWQIEEEENFNGVLHQQGRVHLDSDLNDQVRIDMAWKDGAGRDVVGPDVAAVPAHTPDAFKVTEAEVTLADDVVLQVTPGKVWADGKVVHLLGEEPDRSADVARTATYLQPPLQDPPGDVDSIEAGVRDAVILELWREALNGFQVPEALIEPALGGPDTTERIQTALRFRLFRMGENDNCRNIIDRLRDDFSQKLRLKVSLMPSSSSDGDCPVMEGGGYVGFEHHFYRLEMAQVDGSQTMFKWSQFNGGLVGRGDFETTGPDKKMIIKANDQAIKTCGSNSFYMEVIEHDEDQGYWRLTYGAEVTLDGNELVVGAEHYTESSLPGSDVFFRLWNDIENITSFPIGLEEPNELRDGIRLEFDTGTGDNYRPGDFWTFKVRAGGVDYHDPADPLIDNLPPEGVHYTRVPLAILHWNDERSISFEAEEIDDCRHIFRPLTRQKVCCSFTIGDGVNTFGDFNSLEEGLRHLPNSGGELCLLPGLHFASLLIEGKENIKIRGCDRRTQVIPPESDVSAPIFHVKDSTLITLEHMDMQSVAGTAIVIEGSEWGSTTDVEVHHNRIIAWLNAVHADQVTGLSVHHNLIRMWDVEEADVAIFFRGEGAQIERNRIFVKGYEEEPETGEEPNGEPPPTPEEECPEEEDYYDDLVMHGIRQMYFFIDKDDFLFKDSYKARSGIQIGNGSERVRILENVIHGGAGNGITLGSDLDPQDFVGVIDEQTDVEPLVLEDEMNTLRGHVEEDGSRIDEVIDVLFTNVETNVVSSATTDSSGGYYIGDLPPGTYNISIAEDEYRVVGHGWDAGEYVIEVEQVEPSFDLTEVFAFIYQVAIEGNQISGMGLSGIGLPLATLQDLYGLAGSADPATVNVGLAILVILMVLLFGFVGGFVVDLRVEENRIRQCARQIPGDEGIPFLRLEGGISLGFCEDVRLRSNRIENNGVEQNGKVYGLCSILAEQMEISGNHLIDNGPSFDEDGNTSATGVLGGVFVMFSTAFSLGTKLLSSLETATQGEFAARIFDNVIDQPVGRALTMLAFGPLAVNNNYFNTITSTGNSLDLLVGSVFIANFGGMDKMTDLEVRAARSGDAAENDEEEPMGSAPPGASGNSGDLNIDMELPPAALLHRRVPNEALAQKRQALLPDGNTLYANNQVHLGAGSRSALAQLIVTADDLGYANNQCAAMNSLEGMETMSIILGMGELEFASLINTVLLARTLRATDSRFKESYVEEFGLMAVSLLSISFFHNNTTSNQGDHCIVAVAWKESDFSAQDALRVSILNQVLLNPIRDCKAYEEWIAGLNDEQRVQFMALVMIGLLMGRVF